MWNDMMMFGMVHLQDIIDDIVRQVRNGATEVVIDEDLPPEALEYIDENVRRILGYA